LVEFANRRECQKEVDAVALAIKCLISPPPLAMLIVTCIALVFYPIDSERAKQNAERIKQINE
jgi:Na+/melibiose symporter-like transporter